jgi:hypothetical protein
LEAEDLNVQDQRDSRRRANGRLIQELADPLKWIGIAFLATYVASVVAAALPVKLLNPVWINRLCGSIRGGVSFPLEAMALILIGAYLQRTANEPPMVTNLRRLCSWVAVGFVLMIPLQSWTGQKVIDLTIQDQQAKIQPSDRALRAVYAASNTEELLEAISLIPGAPPNVGGRFELPMPKVRERLISEIEPQVLKQKEQLKQVISDIRREGLVGLVKDGIVALFSALAFAAIGRSNPYRLSMLQKLVGPHRSSSGGIDELVRLADEYEET